MTLSITWPSLAVPVSPDPTPPSDVAAALGDRAPMFARNSNFIAILQGMGRPVDDIVDAVEELRSQRLNLDLATGVFLDMWGTVFGAARLGRDDDEYRKIVKIFALVLMSRGVSIEKIKTVVELYTESPPVFHVEDVASYDIGVDTTYGTLAELLKLLRLVTQAGVGINVIQSTDPDDDILIYDYTPGDPDPVGSLVFLDYAPGDPVVGAALIPNYEVG